MPTEVCRCLIVKGETVHFSGSLAVLLRAQGYLRFVSTQFEAYQILRDWGEGQERDALALLLFEQGYKVQKKLYPLLQAEFYPT